MWIIDYIDILRNRQLSKFDYESIQNISNWLKIELEKIKIQGRCDD